MSDLYNLKPSGIMVYSAVWCPDCKRAKQFFGEQRVPYTNVDIEQDERAMAFRGAGQQRDAQHPHHHLPRRRNPGRAVECGAGQETGTANQGAAQILRRDRDRQRPGRLDGGAVPGARGTGYAGDRKGRAGRAGGHDPGHGELPRLRPRASPGRSSPSGWDGRRASSAWKSCKPRKCANSAARGNTCA